MSFKRLILVCLVLTKLACATHYYVANGGSDSNNGTSLATPFLTINHANAVVVAGDTVHVQPGTYTPLVVTNKSGTSTARITYISDVKWGAHVVTSGSTTHVSWTNSGAYVTVDGFDITGNGYQGIRANGSFNIIQNMRVHDIPTEPGCTGNGGAGIATTDYTRTDISFIGNLVFNMGHGLGTCNKVQGIYISTLRGKAINNIVHDISANAIGSWHAANNLVISNNLVFNNGAFVGTGYVGGGIVVGDGDAPGGIINDNTVVSNNIIFQNGGYAIREYGQVGLNNKYQNNNSYGNGVGITLLHGLVATGTITGNPQFVNYKVDGSGDYHLLSTSPDVDGGVTLGAPATDADGIARPQGTAVDVGPYEYTPPPPVGATNYYVSPSGNDTNTGTSLGAAWLTIAHANAIVGPGDTVHVQPGTYTIAATLATTTSGTATNKITFVSDFKQTAKIVATGPLQAVWTVDAQYVVIDGFEITANEAAGIVPDGILFNDGNNTALRNHIHHLTSNCTTGGRGIRFGSVLTATGNLAAYNNIHHIKQAASCGTQQGAGIYISVGGSVFHHNIVHNNGRNGINSCANSGTLTIANNLTYHNIGSGILIGRNGGTHSGSVVINNISLFNTTANLAEAGSGTNPIGSNTYQKNILYGEGFGGGKNINLLTTSGNTCPTCIFSNPQMGNYKDDGSGEYHELSSSPARNVAATSIIYPFDYDGVSRPQESFADIGPFEFIPPTPATLYPKAATTSKTTQTANNTSTPSWAEGANPTWTGCSGYHCLITTKGLTACDGTTAAPTFCEITVPRPANISGVDDGVSLRDLLYPGSTTHLQTHYQGWFCPTGTRCNGHINLGVLSNSTAQITKELQEMHDIGIRGVQHYWQGRPYGSASYPNVCAATDQKNKCYLDESTQKVRDLIENTPAFQDMDYSVVYSTEANNDCDASPDPTNCGDGTAQSCALVDDLVGIDDRHQHCSNALSTECTASTGCPTGGSCIWNGCTSNDKAVVDLNWLDVNLWQSPRYQTDNGRPVVYLFGFSNTGQNWTAIRAALTGNPEIISRFNNGSNPMTEGNFDGGWGWQGRPSSDCYGYTTTFAGGAAESTGCGLETCGAHGTDIYACASTKAQAAPTKFYAEGIHSQHDNRSTPWAAPNGGSAPTKIDPPFCGNTWLKSFTVLNSKWSSASQVKFATQVTWDDVDESSAIKAGIESCWRFQAGSPYLVGNTLKWTIEKYDTDGAGPQVAADATTATLNHFRLFVSGGGITPTAYSGDALVQATTIPVSTGTCSGNTCTFSKDLSTLGLNSALQYISLKLVGKAGIQTKYSPVVYYIGTSGSPAPNNPPVVSLSLSPIVGNVPILTTATISATDPDGIISSATINWGDGVTDTVTGLTSKTHTYGAAGTYTVVYSATDDKAAVSTTTKSFTANNAPPPPVNSPPVVTMTLAPTEGIIPILTTATILATDSDGTISLATINWGDGTIDTVTGLTSKTHTYTVAGNYTVTYSATDNSAATATITRPFVASISAPPVNNAPTVSLSLAPNTGTVPILTTATISASDSDGTISSASISWGDGTTNSVTGLGVKTHTYVISGTFTVTYSATDNSGATSTTTQTFIAVPRSPKKHGAKQS